MYSYGPQHMAVQKQDDQHEHTFSNYVRIQDVVQKTCLRRWMIGKSGERGSGISVLPARHDDDDDDIRHKTRRNSEISHFRSSVKLTFNISIIFNWIFLYFFKSLDYYVNDILSHGAKSDVKLQTKHLLLWRHFATNSYLLFNKLYGKLIR